MAGKSDLGKTFLEELMSKLPEALRPNLVTIISSPEAQAALDLAGSRVSPLDEERARLTELRNSLDTRETRLTQWKDDLGKWKTDTEALFQTREQKVAARETGTGDNPPPPAAKPGEASMTKAEMQKAVEDVLIPREAAYISYVADAVKFATFHLQNFKEPLDVSELVRHPKIGELGVRGVYELVHKEKLDKMSVDAKAAERATLKDELRRELQTETPVDMPYPIGEGSPLDVLTMAADQRPKGDPATAARMYDQLVSGRP